LVIKVENPTTWTLLVNIVMLWVLSKFLILIFFVAQQPLVGHGLLIIRASGLHSDTPQSVVLLWTSDQPNAEVST
jgi:hypothetical protein